MIRMTKYGVPRNFYIPIPKAGSTSFALAADWTPAVGDVKISKDGLADANIATLPAAMASTAGLWCVYLSGPEVTAKQINVRIMAAAVVHDALEIVTFGDPLAQHAMDFNLRNDALGAIFYGSVTGAVTPTTLIDATLTQADTDFFKGRILLPLTGTQRFQASKITAFNPSTDQLTFDAMTQAMAGGDKYAIC